jgi:hypothetical protein
MSPQSAVSSLQTAPPEPSFVVWQVGPASPLPEPPPLPFPVSLPLPSAVEVSVVSFVSLLQAPRRRREAKERVRRGCMK